MEAIDVHRHAAEKFHGMLRDFGERENSRVRDLLGPVILLEHDLLTPAKTAAVSTGRGLVCVCRCLVGAGLGMRKMGMIVLGLVILISAMRVSIRALRV